MTFFDDMSEWNLNEPGAELNGYFAGRVRTPPCFKKTDWNPRAWRFPESSSFGLSAENALAPSLPLTAQGVSV